METRYKPMFSGTEKGVSLSVDQAKKKVQKFNCNRKKEDIKAHYFSKAFLKKILEQENAVGIRVYYGMNEKADLDAVIVGVAANGDNLINQRIKSEKDAAGDCGYYSSGQPCPRWCPSSSTNPNE